MLSIQNRLVLNQLDNTKISYRKYAHSSCSMRVIGVYPEIKKILKIMVQAVKQEVQGTFDGRFVCFDKGFFEYIAYTD